jgi:hypothetical protein
MHLLSTPGIGASGNYGIVALIGWGPSARLESDDVRGPNRSNTILDMTWKPKITEYLADVLRFVVRGALYVDAILLAIASIYLTIKFLWRAIEFLDRVIFAKPW